MSQSGVQKTTLVWHGGEPLLLGEDFFNQVFFQSLIFGHKFNIEVRHSIQTNLTIPLSEKFIRILQHYNVPIGTSIDLPTEYQNDYRFGDNPLGKSTWMTNMLNLEKYHVGRSINCVITDQNYTHMREFYTFCKKLKTSFTIAPLIPNTENEIQTQYLSNEHYVTAFKDLYDVFTNDTNPVLAQTIVEMVSNIIVRRPRLCVFQRECNKNFLGLDAKGNLYQCARYIGNERYRLCNILFDCDINLVDKLSQCEQTPTPVVCKECEFYEICNGGCPFMRELSNGVDTHCQAYKEIYSFIEKQSVKLELPSHPKPLTSFPKISRKHQDVVIIAPGASADEVLCNNAVLHDIDIITINSMFTTKRLKVDFCFTIDQRVIKTLTNEISSINETIFITCFKNIDFSLPNMYPIKTKKGIGFSADHSDGVYLCGSSSYAAMQFAFSLGYQHIYMIGFDLGTYKDRLYSIDYSINRPEQIKVSDRINRFEQESIAYKFLSATHHDVLKRIRVVNLSKNHLLSHFIAVPEMPIEYITYN